MTTVEERLSRLEGVYDHLSSKADVAKVETQIADLRTELKGDIAKVERQVDGLRVEMYRINASSMKWLLSFMAASMVVGLGAVTAIVRFLG